MGRVFRLVQERKVMVIGDTYLMLSLVGLHITLGLTKR